MLKLITSEKKESQEVLFSQALQDHNDLITHYLQSHKIRNHSPKTIQKEKKFLESWFEEHEVNSFPLLTWEAMKPVEGRKRIVDYGNALIETGIRSETVRSYLGILSRYFSYVLEHPFIMGESPPVRLQDRYGAIDQPVSEFDYPHHTYDGERLGVPLDPEKLYEFYANVRNTYVATHRFKNVASRNYCMIVLTGESGLRADELLNLETSDLFFESKKLQTRFAKGTSGSGKRSRITLFPPLARDTVKYYLKEVRPRLCKQSSVYLFPSQNGKALTYSGMHTALVEIVSLVKKNGFPILSHMGWHWFRRIFATRFIERFPNQLSTLITLLGHTSPNTVHRYIQHSQAWTDKQIQNVLEGATSWPSIGE